MTRLDIFSDPICPWCHVGKLNLDRAMADAPRPIFDIHWHPFMLNPEMPAEGVDKRAYLESRFGGAARVDAMHERLREVARKAGVELDPDRPQRLPNTLDAHRLIHWSAIEGCQQEAVGAIFQAYWDEGRDIGRPEVLADIAEALGMQRAGILKLLASDADRDDLLAREQDARAKGVSAVPTFLIAKYHVVSGAQGADLWRDVIQELQAQS